MKTNIKQNKKTTPEEKIAKGLRLLIKGCLDQAQLLNLDLSLSEGRQPTVEEVARNLLIDTKSYLDKAERYSPPYIKDLNKLTTRYESIQHRFDELTT